MTENSLKSILFENDRELHAIKLPEHQSTKAPKHQSTKAPH
jgi:hypothetical protein